MRGIKIKFLFTYALILFFTSAPLSLGDWDTGDGHKMHYPQLPKPGGWDVATNSSPGTILADDWFCIETGPVSDIHFWASWRNNLVSTIDRFQISIYSDQPDPDGPGPEYSEPNELLWGPIEFRTDQGDFTVRSMPPDLQGWFDMWNSEDVIPQDHNQWCQINITDINNPFIQQEGNIYWLAISNVEVNDVGAELGWKESDQNFNDDAVYGIESYGWEELTDPCTGTSMDLAFVITGRKLPVPHLKWSQPPIEMDPNAEIPTFWGWDEPSFKETGIYYPCWDCPTQCHGDADCDGFVGPTDVHIFKLAFGTIYGDPEYNYCADFDRNFQIDLSDFMILKTYFDSWPPPDCTPAPFPSGLSVDSSPKSGDAAIGSERKVNKSAGIGGGGSGYWDLFCVNLTPNAMYWNLVNGGTGILGNPLVSPDPSGGPVIDNFTPLGGVAYGFGGLDWGNGTLESDVAAGYTIQLIGASDYYLSVVLDTKTMPNSDGVFPSWGTISNIVVTPGTPGNWGAPIVPNWVPSPFDPDGGTVVAPGLSSSVTLASNDFGAPEGATQAGDSQGIWGAAAQLPPAAGYRVDFNANVITWDSYGLGGLPPPPPTTKWQLVADDFRCIGDMPIASIHWWGSHVGWEDPCELPPASNLPVAWLIGFWSNVPAGVGADYSYPEELLWQIEVPENRVDVDQVGTDEWCGYYPNDVSYQYYLDLEPNEYFWQDDFNDMTDDHVFWLSIVAIYPDACEPPDYPWGWKTRPWSWMDDAVRFEHFGPLETGMSLNPYTNYITPIEDPIYYESYDVAFELDTDPNYIKWEQPFTGIRDWPHYEDELSMALTTEEPATKYVQYPDLNTTGMDVLAGPLSVDPCVQNVHETFLADDFACTSSGPITDIHIWASYNQDIRLTNFPWFSLAIYENVPADPCIPYSRPGAVLWDAYMQPTVEWIYATAEESFYDPNQDEIIGLDWTVWRFDFDIDPAEAFVQEEGEIYWLGVHHSFDLDGDGFVSIPDFFMLRENWPAGPFGWKTSLDHFEDDAVWTDVLTWASDPHVVPSGEIWNELRYPIGHPFDGNSIDLAFEITTPEPEPNILHLVADDWPCDQNTPVMAVVWWGSYINYSYNVGHIEEIPPPMALPVKPDYFRLNIWTDVPEDPNIPVLFSHPNEIIWEYDAYDYDEVLVGYDKHPVGGPNEPVFRYSVRLPEEEWFLQDDVNNNIYWLSVVAVYDVNIPNYDWGWTNHKHVFLDDAVEGYVDPPSGWFWYELYDQGGESEDMSFILFADPGPPCWRWPKQCHGDVVLNDQQVKLGDFFDFKDAYGKNYWNHYPVNPDDPQMGEYNPCADCDRDGDVDLADFFIFKASYTVTDVSGFPDCPPGGVWPPL